MPTRNTLDTAAIRQIFLDYFSQRGHQLVRSSSLVPGNDPTLLFVNAGMVQFKEVFQGAEKRDFVRAVSSQCCVRAGGKHNDLDQVGYTARHHTFFEMLGNFSFGDYFKREAIEFAWEFLTEVVGLPEEKLWVTVFEEDDEAWDLWHKHMGVPEERLTRIGAKDNFWAMGDTGPCGPCSEIFYDHGPDVAGGPPGTPDEEGDRYVEIWNLVFMQYDRDSAGKMTPLPKPCVDTGMGLERLAAILQGVHNNYDIDLFQALIKSASELTGCGNLKNKSLRVIADHIRACSFLIVDGVLPGNEGRAYVLRRIIRRALRHGYKLGCKTLFFHRMVAPLVVQMGQAYPELAARSTQVAQILEGEEKRFAITLEKGMKILEAEIDQMGVQRTINGAVVAKLYDTYGFPADLTADVAREHGLNIDEEGFEREMDKQRDRGRKASRFAGDEGLSAQSLADLKATAFVGYDALAAESCVVIGLYSGSQAVERLVEGESGIVILDRTPFYAESGGQTGDTGEFHSANLAAQVTDTRKVANVFHAHQVSIKSGSITNGDNVNARVDAKRRQAIVANHSATHLLHAALRQTLGDHVQQKGSYVGPDHLRFDFSHFEPVSAAQLRVVENLVNAEIRGNCGAKVMEMDFDAAVASGAMALFGEKYGDQVRVVRFGDYSVELCGGAHAKRAGDIGLLKVTVETGVAAGIRRIEAVTGNSAMNWVSDNQQQLLAISQLLKSAPGDVTGKVRSLLEKNKSLEKEILQANAKLAAAGSGDLLENAVKVGDIHVLAAQIENADSRALREQMDKLRDKLGRAIVVLGSAQGTDKVNLVAGVSKDLISQFKAGELVNAVAMKVGGRGGGRPDMAMAGGKDVTALADALGGVVAWVEAQVDDS